MDVKGLNARNDNDDVYASIDLATSLPKSGFPDEERNPHNVFSAIRDELMLDGNSRQNLATFCQTWVDDEIRNLMDLSIDKNMIDKDEYPQTAEIEARCVRMLSRSLELTLARNNHGMLDDWLFRSRNAWRASA